MKPRREPNREPDFQDVGRAWKLEWVPRPRDRAALAGWLVDTTGYGHPFWPWYYVGAVHLRDEEGVSPAAINDPEATHEFQILALNPEQLLPDVDDWTARPIHYLMPPNLTRQFTVRSDEQAVRLTEILVERICRGESPEAAGNLWNAIVTQTAEHLCYGGHPSWN